MSAIRKVTIARLILDTAAVVAVLGVAAAPAYAINQDQTDGTGVVLPADRWTDEPAAGGGFDATSAALGVLGGIAFGGAGLAVTLGVQRRRDHTAPRPV